MEALFFGGLGFTAPELEMLRDAVETESLLDAGVIPADKLQNAAQLARMQGLERQADLLQLFTGVQDAAMACP